MTFNGVIGANCISKIFRDRLMDSIKPESENDLQLNVLLDTLEKLPDCSKLLDEGQKPLEPGKKITESGDLVDMDIPKKPRKLSAYQQFMSTCAKKENGGTFQSCVFKWREYKHKKE